MLIAYLCTYFIPKTVKTLAFLENKIHFQSVKLRGKYKKKMFSS